MTWGKGWSRRDMQAAAVPFETREPAGPSDNNLLSDAGAG
jgi:hypothetical protein